TEQFTVPGPLKASRSRRTFAYRAQRGSATRGVQMFRITLRNDGYYNVRFTLVGVDMSPLETTVPWCVPLAIIVGDDDFFNGVSLDSPGLFTSKHVVVKSSCNLDNSAWPWIRG